MRPLTPENALAGLAAGNSRFAAGKPEHPNTDSQRRRDAAHRGQQPFATVLACADSRAPVERLFDLGIGDLFVVRVAGNVAGPETIASIEFGVVNCQTPLLVVLGHTQCGAITAAVQNRYVRGNQRAVLDKVRPAVEVTRQAQPQLADDELVRHAVLTNVWQSIADLLRHSGELRDRARVGQLKVVGAIYDLGTGRVAWLGPHPGEREMLGFTA